MRIGIFGGTFNPPHRGHRHIAEDFREQMAAIGLPLDKVLIIPTFVPPHKETPDLASGEDRLAMCEMCFRETPEEGDAVFEVSDYEIARADVSYTYMTLEHLHEEWPGAELYFVMGDDMLLYLPKWARPEKILEDAVLVSTIRSHECTVEALKAFAKETYPDQYAAGRFLFFESEPFPVSSTEVRALVKKADRPIAKETLNKLLDPEVLQYILERELYQ
ncbi:MAG: nicotinate (nicotinamide) nucleotide adenylyltransferase [Clostridia bacterium]|nr:nicotinate (nicotinamide) nucleotide adenylyltransferase [Clostridia bacterium]